MHGELQSPEMVRVPQAGVERQHLLVRGQPARVDGARQLQALQRPHAAARMKRGTRSERVHTSAVAQLGPRALWLDLRTLGCSVRVSAAMSGYRLRCQGTKHADGSEGYGKHDAS